MGAHADDPDDFFQFDGASAPSGPAVDSSGEVGALPVPPRLGLLAGLTESEFTAVARAAELKVLEGGRTIFKQGQEADRFFILIDGSVHIERDGATIATLGPGSFFGESALLVGGKRSASVITDGPSSVWSVGYEAFKEVVSHHLLADEAAKSEVEQRIQQAPPESFA